MSRRNFMQSRNPVIREKAFQQAATRGLTAAHGGATMTVEGAVNKTYILGAILLATALIGYSNPSSLMIWGGLIGGIIALIIAIVRPAKSKIFAPIYAGFEGLFVGGITGVYAMTFDGIVLKAVTLTFGVFFAMLFLYKSGLIKVTQKFRSGVYMATGAIALVYIVSIIGGMFGFSIPFLHDASPIGILISLVIIGVAALNLLLDFDMFEKGEEYGAPKYMEWMSAMGLIVTLVWLYIEILRLVSILSGD